MAKLLMCFAKPKNCSITLCARKLSIFRNCSWQLYKDTDLQFNVAVHTTPDAIKKLNHKLCLSLPISLECLFKVNNILAESKVT